MKQTWQNASPSSVGLWWCSKSKCAFILRGQTPLFFFFLLYADQRDNAGRTSTWFIKRAWALYLRVRRLYLSVSCDMHVERCCGWIWGWQSRGIASLKEISKPACFNINVTSIIKRKCWAAAPEEPQKISISRGWRAARMLRDQCV